MTAAKNYTASPKKLCLTQVDVLNSISGREFKEKYFLPGIPLVIKDISREWPAYSKWNWNYLKEMVGNKKIGVYNNKKTEVKTRLNKADDYTTFGNYIDMVSSLPAGWRIFLFNLHKHTPEITKDFTWPEHLMTGFAKRAPMLFVGGKGSINHMHFDVDLSHILHTQFLGRKRVLLFPYHEQRKLYRKPYETASSADFSYYYDERKSKVDTEKFPALSHAKGFDITLCHGDTLFIPGGYWHHMEYLESGFAMNMHAFQESLTGRLKGTWNAMGMSNIDALLKKTMSKSWSNWKEKKTYEYADIVQRSEYNFLNEEKSPFV